LYFSSKWTMKGFDQSSMADNKTCFFVIPKFVLQTYTSRDSLCPALDPEQEKAFEAKDWTTMISTRTNNFYPSTQVTHSVGFVRSFFEVSYSLKIKEELSFHKEFFAEVSIFRYCGICKVTNQLIVNLDRGEPQSISFIFARHASNQAFLTPIHQRKYIVSFGHDMKS
jgi:hypothetical protein